MSSLLLAPLFGSLLLLVGSPTAAAAPRVRVALEDGESAPDDGQDASEDAEDGIPSTGAEAPDSRTPWGFEDPSIEPAVSAMLFPTAGGGVTGFLAVGGEGAIRFRQETEAPLHGAGRARAVAQVLFGQDFYNGYSGRVGAFAGPRFGPARLQVGPDFFASRYVVSGVDATPLTGIGLPLTASLAGKRMGLQAGVEPAWYITSGWDGVDWADEDAFGLGDEFTYQMGAFISTRALSVGLGYTHRIMSIGVQRGLVFGVGF